MKGIKMQCKDIDEMPILIFLLEHKGRWCNWYFDDERDVRKVMPPGLPSKLILAKMGNLIRRGLADGCTCGCRGDFEITEKGEEYLAKKSPVLRGENTGL
jgi:predicted transcriptional regulator